MTPIYCAVAVPAPMAEALTYALPEGDRVRAGCRVRVPLGSRRLVGVVTAVGVEPPAGLKIREIDAVLDREPVLGPELLALAAFISRYYQAPIGETVRSMVPSDLPPWGDLRVSLTDSGALASHREAPERALVDHLLENPRARLADVRRTLAKQGFRHIGRLIETLSHRGWLSLEGRGQGRKGTRFVKAVELRPVEVALRARASKGAPKAAALLAWLEALGRPATYTEIRHQVGCGPGVMQRLITHGVLRAFTQPARLSLERHRLVDEDAAPLVLRQDQASALAPMLEALEAQRYQAFLLAGMTGSGKTEVYLRLAAAALAAGRSALLLVPEIALVPALAQAARSRFGDELAILHSNLSAGERHQEWERIRRGAARVVLGPRSAVFAPVARLGAVIVDEEHDSAYKQDKTPRYNGRDVALMRARAARSVAILVSATPSLESRRNAELKKLTPLALVRRANAAQLPASQVVDLRREPAARLPGEVPFSEALIAALDEALSAGDQVILLRNRRGFAPMFLCRACGEDFRCPDCGLPLTMHRRRSALICHYCDHQRPVPEACPSCGEQALDPIGAGTERVEERFRALFPDTTVDLLDADAARGPGGSAAILARFAAGTSQVLIGTQMVAKGHHFPRVSLAAVMAADTYLSFPDFRAVERTYALITQIAGRAGRGSRPGRVVIQTYHPDHYAIRAALDNDDAGFAVEELRFRRMFHYPPYTRLVHVLVQDKDRGQAERTIHQLYDRLTRHREARGLRFAGPAAAPLERLRARWRFQLLVRGADRRALERVVRESLPRPLPLKVTVDVDPYDVM